MQRRDFVKSVGLAAAASAVAAPALAAPAIVQSSPQVVWRLTSSFPAVLDALYGGADVFSRAVSEATDGRFHIEIHPAGEIASALDVFDAVSKGAIDCAQTALQYHWGAEPALALATSVPFGMNAREQNAFFRQGGGTDLFNEILVDHSLFALPAGNTGCQMGGWFRKELRSTADLKGLKYRISGLAGKVMQKLGSVPTAVARKDLASSLQSGALDAAAWVAPYDDERLKLTAIAPNYYYPGWFQGSMAIHLVFNLAKWNALPKSYQAIVRGAAELANVDMQAKYDAFNPPALKRVVSAGAKLRAFPDDVMEAAWQAAIEVYREAGAADPKFKRVHEAYMNFRNDEYLWWQVGEYPYDNFIIRQRAKG
ncbi:MAG TPA: TRAP transporter substrate-binding protein DctP [Beijerinckiaceae bacterium]|nr:TRAP transporter substrate-binding protein DctP [Beijerinckiaceae bacterium]HVB89431.1 TRAP transporter substrate-binding protein DctP [Beijerinckiaceae bacterium]